MQLSQSNSPLANNSRCAQEFKSFINKPQGKFNPLKRTSEDVQSKNGKLIQDSDLDMVTISTGANSNQSDNISVITKQASEAQNKRNTKAQVKQDELTAKLEQGLSLNR